MLQHQTLICGLQKLAKQIRNSLPQTPTPGGRKQPLLDRSLRLTRRTHPRSTRRPNHHPPCRLRQRCPFPHLLRSWLHDGALFTRHAIIPITDRAYFDNDIVTRFVEFLRVAYGSETLTENLNFIANALKLKNGESAQERIRRYFAQKFISDHIQTYKKRPIYWLFTSGKKRAFGALVYLHRYNEDTLARIRIDYVLELQVKLDGEITRAQQQLDNASSSTAKKAATNRLKELQAQQLELREYQAKLQT